VTKIERSIEIDVRGERVFGVLVDLDRLPVWSTITVETHRTPGQPIERGDTFEQTLRILGRNLESRWRVVDLDPPRSVAYEAEVPGGGLLRMVQRVHDSGGRSRVDFELDYELPGGIVGEWVDGAFAQRRNERELEHSVHNLKELLEG
jgi:uncharacterized membrane protein